MSISYTYHKHIDAAGNKQSDEYQASVSGGCFTKENIVYTTTTGPCGNLLFQNGTIVIHHEKIDAWVTAYKYDCPVHGHQATEGYEWSGYCTVLCAKQVDTGERYYTVNCGKTEDSIATATLSFN